MTENERERLDEARSSFTGRTLTSGQFYESWSLAGVMNREIRKSGSFRDKLTDYSHAFSRSEKFDALRGETIIRDIFKSRYGETMNQLRERLMEREKTLSQTGQEQALHHARQIEGMIRDGDTMPFYQAYDKAAVNMARKHAITEAGAKTLIRESYEQSEGKELYQACKELEEKYHTPKREAQSRSRQDNETPKRSGRSFKRMR